MTVQLDNMAEFDSVQDSTPGLVPRLAPVLKNAASPSEIFAVEKELEKVTWRTIIVLCRIAYASSTRALIPLDDTFS